MENAGPASPSGISASAAAGAAELAFGGLACQQGRKAPVVPGYRILNYVDRGGEGTVWRAARLSDSREVALKVPHDAEECSERLLREARRLSSLDHPGVTRMLEVVETPEKIPVLVLEWIEGRNLADLIVPGGLAFAKVAALFEPILEAVHYAHSRGVVHRDLKPANVVLNRAEQPKILDFGLSKTLVPGSATSSMITLSGHVAGTVDYLCPEGFEPGRHAGVAADVYALGIMLYELLTGQPPRGSWVPLSRVKRLDVRLDALMAEATAANPRQRLQSVEVFRRRLHRISTSRPQYYGHGLSRLRVRIADLIWTVCGLYAVTAGFFSMRRLEGSVVPALFDLTLGRGILLGGMRSAAILCMLLGVMWIWQMIRLRIFHNVRMRDALPRPFGLKWVKGGAAVAVTGLTQVICLWAGFFVMVNLFFHSNHWLTSRTPRWQTGLCMTAAADLEPGNVWTWDPPCFFDPGAYVLREASRSGEAGALVSSGSMPYVPFVFPLILTCGAGAALAGILATTLAAWLEWRQRHGLMALLPVGLMLAGFGYTGYESRRALAEREEAERGHLLNVRERNRELFDRKNADWRTLILAAYNREYSEHQITELTPTIFAPEVSMRGVQMSLEEVTRWLLDTWAGSYRKHQTVENLVVVCSDEVPGQIVISFDHFTDRDPEAKADGKRQAEGFHVVLKWRGPLREASRDFRFTHWDCDVTVCFWGGYFPGDPKVNEGGIKLWLNQFLGALGETGVPQAEKFFPEELVRESGDGSSGTRLVTRETAVRFLRQLAGDISRPKFRTVEPPEIRPLSAGRWEVRCRVRRDQSSESVVGAESGDAVAGAGAEPGAGTATETVPHPQAAKILDWRLEVFPDGDSWQIVRMDGL